MKKIINHQWTPVKLEGSLLNSGDIADLIGIEECIEYDPSSIITAKKKKRKLNLKTESKNNCKKLKTHTDNENLTPSKQGSSTDVNVTEIANDKKDSIAVDVKAWSGYGLPDILLKAIQEQGFEQPTQIQTLALHPAVLGKRDILGAAETGSGKTLAFGLPILAGILKIKEKEQQNDSKQDSESDIDEEVVFDVDSGIECVKVVENVEPEEVLNHKPLYALILTPTRELAVQIKNHLVAVAKYTGIQIALVVGGMAIMKQERVLSKSPEVVVATPGRLWELIQQGNSHLSQIDNLRFLAIDETDRMLEKGHFHELHDLLERINTDENKRKLRQNFVFSATLTLTHELPKHLTIKKKLKPKKGKRVSEMSAEQKLQQIVDALGISNPKVIDITQKSGTAETLSESRITCAIEEKDFYVYYFLQRHAGRTLIFCNSIGCVKRLTTLLSLLNCKPLALHASMQQRQRLRNLDRFRDNENSILIATDVAARGLDIPCIEHVLHYQMPRTSESYVHRSGRTARVSRQGITVLLIEPTELPNYLRLCRNLERAEHLPTFPVQENMLNAVKERVKLARELDKLDLQIRRTNSETGWIEKAAEEMDIIIDDSISTKYDAKEVNSLKKVAEVKRKQLLQLLVKPIFPKGFSSKFPVLSGDSNVPFGPIQKTSENALDVLKKSLENDATKIRKSVKWLFKSKQKTNIPLGKKGKITGMQDKKQKKRNRKR